ncbi:chloramphenicol hydrolase [Novosphingobium sp.]|uniref:chloramphenicol hydrolase n=1 Tax=Novosphingobium sp. TaxID=1874826 RepID=UPI003D0D46AD
MTVNPQVEALLGFFAQMPQVDYATITSTQVRALMDTPMQMAAPLAVASVRDMTIDLPGRTLPARLYLPEDAGESPPLLVFYHGGGWVIGTIDTHDGTCRALARASGAAVLSVGYRLAPETRFPGPLDDCFEALVWAKEHARDLGVDGSRLAVGGDSAGGNLAAAVAIRARDSGGPALRHQLLIYPVTSKDLTTASYRENGSGSYFLSLNAMDWFWQQYLGPQSEGHVEGATLLTTADLSNLPPASLYMAQYDPLRDEGVAYGEALRAAGNSVHSEVVPGMIHGFFSMFEAVPDALPAIAHAGAQLKTALA